MHSAAKDPERYLESLAEERKAAVEKIRQVLLQNLPKGFEEGMAYGMLSYHVPHSLYAPGYHAEPSQPLPFINLASQKNYIALYHMGLYAKPDLLEWFTNEYPKHTKRKLDMGKSCIRFKNMEDIPLALISSLATKMTPKEWISIYESVLKK